MNFSRSRILQFVIITSGVMRQALLHWSSAEALIKDREWPYRLAAG